MLESLERRAVLAACSLAMTVALSADAQVATYHITRAPRPPTLDGRLDDACWRSACVVDSFGPLGGRDAESKDSVRTKAYLAYDAEFLYVACVCEEPMTDRLVIDTKEHDGPTWKDDAVEIFFNPSGDRKRYCQIAVNAAGVIMDNYGELPDKKLDLGYETGAAAAAHVGRSEWTLEVRIPFSGLPIEALDCPWTFHLARHRAVVPQLYTSLRSPVAGFHEIKKFDLLEGVALKERRVAVLNVSMGDMLQGTNLTRLTLRNVSDQTAEALVSAGIAGTSQPHQSDRTVSLPPRGKADVKMAWDLTDKHAGRKEFVSVSVDGKIVRRRERLIKTVPPIFGRLGMRAYYLDLNQVVRIDLPIQLAEGSRGTAKLRWTATDAAGHVIGQGLTTAYGKSAVVRLYWPRWSEGRYTLTFDLTRSGRPIASHHEVIRLVPSPWGGL